MFSPTHPVYFSMLNNNELFPHVRVQIYISHAIYFQNTFSYLWTVFGYAIPVSVLAFCNTHLIRALRESYKMRRVYRVHSQTPQPGSRITPTLVAIVVMFLVLVSPSEIIQFLFYIVEDKAVEHLNFATVITNLLHTMNFSLNFVLYCIVNVHFRNTIKCIILRKEKGQCTLKRQYTATYSNVTTKTYGITPSNIETIV